MPIFGLTRQQWSWAWYDWANSAFATTVMAGLFPVFYKTYWHLESSAATGTFHLGLVNALASLFVALSAPLLGALADALGRRKGMLLLFALLGILSTGSLVLIAEGAWLGASLLYMAAIIGFSSSNLFYDSLLLFISPRKDRNRLSSLGFALGYLGGGLLLALNVWMIRQPGLFGLHSATEAVQAAFLMVSLWWALFSLPLLIWVEEPSQQSAARQTLAGSLRKIQTTLKNIRKLPETFWFLLAYWLYIDGVDTVIRMAVDYGLNIGLSRNALISALLITQFVGFPAALLYARLGASIGTRQAILLGLVVYIGITLWASKMNSETAFYALAIAVGLVQGGIQALSRALYSRLIPHRQASEFFGFYNLLGKFAAVLGPLMVGSLTLLTENPRLSILSLLLLFVAGGWLLSRVDIRKGEADANTG